MVDLRCRGRVAAKRQIRRAGRHVIPWWRVPFTKELRVKYPSVKLCGLFRIRHGQPNVFEPGGLQRQSSTLRAGWNGEAAGERQASDGLQGFAAVELVIFRHCSSQLHISGICPQRAEFYIFLCICAS